MRYPLLRTLGVVSALIAIGCESTKSADPLSPNIAGPIAGVSITVPQPVAPNANAQVSVAQQPIGLVIANAKTTGVRPVAYDFVLASDAAFANTIVSQTGVPAGTSGQTTFTVPSSLASGSTYYWRVRADDGANTSSYSAPMAFQVFTPVVIQPPTLVSPADGSTVTTATPTLTVTNASRTGPAGAISYDFETSTDASFAGHLTTSSVPENSSGKTSYVPSSSLLGATKYFWRVRASDPSHVGPYSTVQSFTTPAAAPVTPPPASPTPPSNGGSSGGSTNGGGSGLDGINMSQATILNSPSNLASWAVTSTISSLTINSGGVGVNFTQENGANRWPDVIPPGFTGPLEYTLGMCLDISSHWYCSAVIEFWNGLSESGGPPSQYAQNWFYDPARWAPMTGHQPAVGETIGFFVCEGDCRNNTSGSSSPLRERSNVVLIKMPTDAGGTYTF